MAKNDPAFPIGSGDMRDPIGLTKLEWFAGIALRYWINTDTWSTREELVSRCFDLAEAMLAESERRSK